MVRKQKLPFDAVLSADWSPARAWGREARCSASKLSSGMRSSVWSVDQVGEDAGPIRVCNPPGLSRRNTCIGGDLEARSGRMLAPSP